MGDGTGEGVQPGRAGLGVGAPDGTGTGVRTPVGLGTGEGDPDGTVKARLARGRAALAPYLRESVGPRTAGGAARRGQEESDV